MTDVYDIGKTVWVKQIGQTNILVFFQFRGSTPAAHGFRVLSCAAACMRRFRI
jgi:hypothetical protein